MAKGMLSGSTYNRDARPKKSRQGTFRLPPASPLQSFRFH